MVKKSNKAWYFLLFVVIIYIILLFINQPVFIKSSLFFLNTLKKIIPIFILIFILMALMNYFVTPKTITKHFKDKKIKAWVFSIIAGIISMGAIYLWYPLLAEIRDKKISNGLIACFLYNRAIKLPLLPIIIFYFGIKYVLILTIVMIIMSVVQGVLVEKIVK